MSATPPPPPPEQPSDEIRIRLNPVAGALVLVVGVLLTLFAVALGDLLLVALGGVMLLLGVLYFVGSAAVIRPDQVEVKNPLQMTTKRVSIRGLGDLHLDGKVLRHVDGDKKIANLGWGTGKPADVDALRQAIASAHST